MLSEADECGCKKSFHLCRLRNTKILLILNQKSLQAELRRKRKSKDDDDDETRNSIKWTFASFFVKLFSGQNISLSFMFIVFCSKSLDSSSNQSRFLVVEMWAAQSTTKTFTWSTFNENNHNNDDGELKTKFSRRNLNQWTIFLSFVYSPNEENANLWIPQTEQQSMVNKLQEDGKVSFPYNQMYSSTQWNMKPIIGRKRRPILSSSPCCYNSKNANEKHMKHTDVMVHDEWKRREKSSWKCGEASCGSISIINGDECLHKNIISPQSLAINRRRIVMCLHVLNFLHVPFWPFYCLFNRLSMFEMFRNPFYAMIFDQFPWVMSGMWTKGKFVKKRTQKHHSE